MMVYELHLNKAVIKQNKKIKRNTSGEEYFRKAKDLNRQTGLEAKK